jgi:hypothetical protein
MPTDISALETFRPLDKVPSLPLSTFLGSGRTHALAWLVPADVAELSLVKARNRMSYYYVLR